ncbi:hypothetical protein ES703_18762 [subsurface metagenome]
MKKCMFIFVMTMVMGSLAHGSSDDFETGDFNTFPWEHYGDTSWTITSGERHSGTYSAKAGAIDHDESTTLLVTLDCVSGNISFYRRVSSESSYDYLTFYIDGVEKDRWSGRKDWAEMSFPVTAGTRTFEWTYSKDDSASEGDDTAWIDDIIFPLEAIECTLDAPVLHAEPDITPGVRNMISWDDVCTDVSTDIPEYCSTDVPKEIPDLETITSTLVIGDKGSIIDLDVELDIGHLWDEDLDVFLIAPDGTRVELFTDVGGYGDNFSGTTLDDESSLSITEASAPFTGSFRPEGDLSVLDGKSITGTWTLEVTDDSKSFSGTLNSWSLIVDVAGDIKYYAESAADTNFDNVVANSGWISETSYTFKGLDLGQTYWYRVKARPLETWVQITQSEFETDTLTDTTATSDGDVVLAGGGGSIEQVHVIENPSFELEGGWSARGNSFILLFFAGICPDDIWVSDGRGAACILLSDDYTYSAGDYVYFLQSVDWTGVETLVFDYCSILAGSELTASVLIGDTVVWSKTPRGRIIDPFYDIEVDVSAFSGRHDLKLWVDVNRSGSFLNGILWDNLRTYGSGGYVPSGSIVSAPIRLADDDTWDIAVFNATRPAGTTLTVDVLPATGSTPIPGYANILSGTDLSGLSDRTIRLRANLSSNNTNVTPALHDWSVTCSNASCESDWSNVESSLQSQ